MQSLYPNHPTTWHGQTYCILLRLETLSSLVLTLPFRTLHTFSFHKGHLVSSLKRSYDPLLLLQSSLQFSQSTDPFVYLADIFMMAFLIDTIILLHSPFEISYIPYTKMTIVFLPNSAPGRTSTRHTTQSKEPMQSPPHESLSSWSTEFPSLSLLPQRIAM